MSRALLEKAFPEWIKRYVQLYPFSGMIRITHCNETLYERGFGLASREWAIPIDQNTRFRFYSLTKPFTAIAVLRLAEAGKLSLDDHPRAYIRGAEAFHPDVTIRSLLNHSSGLPDFRQWRGFFEAQFLPRFDKEMWLSAMRATPMNFAPGSATYYGNFNYFLASLIVEELSGMKFADYLNEHVFSPLGMAQACVDASDQILERIATGYDVTDERIVRALPVNIDWMMGAGCGAGTVEDVYRLSRAVQDGLLLTKESWDAILSPNAFGMGLGCAVTRWNGHLRYTHNGGFHGFRTLHVQMPEEDLDLILLSNMGFGNARAAVSEAMLRLFYDADASPEQVVVMDKGFANQSRMIGSLLSPKRPDIADESGEAFSGVYKSASGTAEVLIRGSRGEILVDGWKRLPVYYIGQGVFQHTWIDENYAFTQDKNGQMRFGEMLRA